MKKNTQILFVSFEAAKTKAEKLLFSVQPTKSSVKYTKTYESNRTLTTLTRICTCNQITQRGDPWKQKIKDLKYV